MGYKLVKKLIKVGILRVQVITYSTIASHSRVHVIHNNMCQASSCFIINFFLNIYIIDPIRENNIII